MLTHGKKLAMKRHGAARKDDDLRRCQFFLHCASSVA